MSLEHVRRTYEQLGSEDPFYAVLSRRSARSGGWDPEEFFRTGRDEIDGVLAYLDELGSSPSRGRALDFGCGVGRLSQALAEHFQRVVGVDIAASMVRRAGELNRHGERVRYLVNTTDRLAALETDSFDFAYSSITLQHIPPEAAHHYVEELVRVLVPGGVAVFNVPDGPEFGPRSFGGVYYRFRRGALRRSWKRLRGKPTVEIHYVPEVQVRESVSRAGGEVVDVRRTFSSRSRWPDVRYCVRKPSP
jgi:SAM-dependent methyltransferase